jgi:2-polyprenyl-3-methyl-5-hydroxy-6-metoxy-1,4-benzoquinol methylase
VVRYDASLEGAAVADGGIASTGSGFDAQRAERFASRMMAALNDGALCLMASIGHRTGLFDAMRDRPPATSGEIAARASLNERYVREWLGAMVTSGVLVVDPQTGRFHLPAEHAAYLSRPAGADNLAVFAQYIPLLAAVEDDIVECFRKGGGVPYARYPRFHAVMAEDSGLSVMSSLESRILPLVPGLSDRLARGARMLDAGCGSGRIINRLAELFPNSRFIGLDLSTDAIQVARDEAKAKNLANVEFKPADLSTFDETAEREAYDFVTTFDAVHDQSKPLNLLKGIYRTLAADGVYLMQDIKGSSHVHNNIGHALGTFLYTVSCLHCMTVSLAQGGEGLGAMWGEEKTREYLGKAGFGSVEKHELAHDIQNNWYVVRK